MLGRICVQFKSPAKILQGLVHSWPWRYLTIFNSVKKIHVRGSSPCLDMISSCEQSLIQTLFRHILSGCILVIEFRVCGDSILVLVKHSFQSVLNVYRVVSVGGAGMARSCVPVQWMSCSHASHLARRRL